LNPALVLKAKKELGVDLPPVPDDVDKFDVAAYVESLAKILNRKPGWTAQMGPPLLGLFTFAKVVIYQDMKGNEAAIVRHPLLRALGGDRSGIGPMKDGEIEVDPVQCFNVLDADSSQQEAVEAVRRGESMVLIGPPGTGKSQTIANMIAAKLSEGKTVLFVSEKMAALDVVKRRLDACGLGDHILELHSTSPVKQEVLDSLTAPLRPDNNPQQVDEGKLAQMRSLREELNAYARALHSKRGGLGRSAYDGHGELSLLFEHDQLVFDLPDPLAMTPDALSRAQASLQRLVALRGVLVQRDKHPWADCSLNELAPAQQAELIVRLQDVSDDIGRLQGVVSEFCSKVGFPTPATLEALKRYSALVSATAVSPRPPRHWFDRYEVARLIETATRLRTARNEVASGEEYAKQRYRAEILDFDAKAYYERFEKDYAGIFRFLKSSYRKDMQVLRSFALNKDLGYAAALADLRILRNAQEAKALVKRSETEGAGWFGRYFAGASTDFDILMRDLRWTEGFVNLPGYQEQWAAIAGEGSTCMEDAIRIGPKVQGEVDDLERSVDSVRPSFVNNWIGSDRAAELVKVKEFCDKHLAAKDRLGEWVEFQSTERALRQVGLGQVFDEVVKRQPEMSDLPDMFRKRFWQLWLQRVYADGTLSRFNAAEQNDRIRRYGELDKACLLINRERLKQRLRQRVKAKMMGTDERWKTEVGFLNGLRGGKRLPAVREMLARCPTVLREAKPCFMMSPISVSQFLPAPGNEPMFDLVIFDEASQVVPQDAVCCILRGRQLVVVGDNRQLPPTRFFDKIQDGYDDEDEPELESILDAALTMGLREHMLLFHYRSKQESLIAFSNYHLYGNKLITFPSADPGRRDEGVELIQCKDGVYDRGGKRDNRIEAGVVADLVIEQFMAHPDRSLGVVAFSQAQQDAIIEILDYKLKLYERKKPELDALMDDDRPDPFFVKNLENVQGDERDTMIFSVGYGRDEKGTMALNFGPLNQEGGARRLNVAITRAKRTVKVVSSITSADIGVTDATPAGVRLLRDYLDYAYVKGERVALTATDIAAEEKVEESIAQALNARGYKAIRRVGKSGVRVDVGIMDPGGRDRFILGILCDGPAYRDARTARDREVLRESVLQGLGWRTIRIWSRDWAFDRDRTMRYLEEHIKLAMAANPAN